MIVRYFHKNIVQRAAYRMATLLFVVSVFGTIMPATANAASTASVTSDVKCATSHYLINVDYADFDWMSSTSPYKMYFSDTKGPTTFCREGDQWEQYGTSRCMTLNTSSKDIDEASCSAALDTYWYTDAVSGGYELISSDNGDCIYSYGNALAGWGKCGSSNDVFTIESQSN